MSEIPWLDMHVTFLSDHIDEAVARIRAESLGKIDAAYGVNGVARQGLTAHVKLHASLAFVDVYERMPGYVRWETAERSSVSRTG